MTKPIPEGAERRRPARSCLACRASRVRCLDGEGPEAGEATKKCTRCEKTSRACVWVGTRRGGGHHTTNATDGGASAEGGGRGDGLESHPSLDALTSNQNGVSGHPPFTSTSSWPPLAASYPPLSASFATQLDAPHPPPSSDQFDLATLAASYLTLLHPFTPLLPDTEPELVAYISSASPLLAVAIYSLLHAPDMSLPRPYSNLGTTLSDCQAALLFLHVAYSREREDEAREIMQWLAVTVAKAGWHLIDAPENAYNIDQGFRRGVRALWWECWGLEIMLGVVTGVPFRNLSELSHQVQTSDLVDDNDSPLALRVRALSLLLSATKPPPDDVGEEAARAHALNNLATNLTLITHQTYLASCATLSAATVNQPRLAAQCEAAFMASLIASAATIFLLSSSSHFSSFLAPYSTCGLDTSTIPPMSTIPLLRIASSHIISIVRTSLSPLAPPPTHSPFFGCSLLVAAQGTLLTLQNEQGGWRSVEVMGDVELLEWLLALQAKRWMVAGKVLGQVKALKAATFGAVGLVDRLLLS